ncbi:MAG: GNAT family N-acetyltransferase, partial [Gordonia sp. (in: high G+C Gram-positive bacteria)]
MSGPADPAVLINPARSALTGPHARFAQGRGRVLRYPDDVCPFVALPDDPGPADWADAAVLFGSGKRFLYTAGASVLPPAHWTMPMDLPGVQMVATAALTDILDADADAVPLTAADVAEMTDLVVRTRPGPFRPRTIEMGTYLGIRRAGVLVAKAGERKH